MEVSDRVLEQRANCEISKVESMFEDHKISAHYEKFQEKAMQILEDQKQRDEAEEKQRVKEEEKRLGIGAHKPKRKRRTEEQEAAEVEAQYQKEKEERKRLAEESLAN